jgi:hypothetical protein
MRMEVFLLYPGIKALKFRMISFKESFGKQGRGFFPSLFPNIKMLSPLTSAEVKNNGAIVPLPHTSSWHNAY